MSKIDKKLRNQKDSNYVPNFLDMAQDTGKKKNKYYYLNFNEGSVDERDELADIYKREKNKTKINKFVLFATILLFVFIGFIVFNIVYYPSVQNKEYLDVKLYNDGWIENSIDSTGTPYTLSFHRFGDKIEKNELVLTKEVDRADIDFSAIALSTYYSAIKVEINDELIYQYGSQEDLDTGKKLGNYYAVISLPDFESDVTKVNFKITFLSYKDIYIYGFNVGSEKSLIVQCVFEYIFVLITLFASIAGFIFLIGLKLSKRTKNYFKPEYILFNVFFFACAIWELLDSQYLMLMGLSAGNVCFASFELYMLLPLFLLLFVYRTSEKNKIGKVFDIILLVIIVANFVAVNVLQFFGIFTFIELLITSHIVIGLTLLTSLIQIFAFWIYSRNRKRKELYRDRIYYLGFTIGLFLFTLFAALQLYFFNIDSTESNAHFLRIGILILFFIALLSIIHRINVADQTEKRKAHDFLFDDRRRIENTKEVMGEAFKTIIPERYIDDVMTVYKNRKDALARGSFEEEDVIIKVGHGERHASILVSDIRGFSEISSKLNYNRLGEMLNYYLGTMTDIIEKYGGHVLEFMGDGILAGFGTVEDDDYHADNAIRASIEMQKAMPSINSWNERHGFPNHVECGIGISTGDVFAGVIGSLGKFKYDVLGSNVNLASRIESYTTGGQILISQETKDECHENLGILDNIKATPKGFDQEMTYYYVYGIGDFKLDVKVEERRRLNNPIKVSFTVYKDKANAAKTYKGTVTEVGNTSIVLNTNVKLELFESIKVNHKEGVTCKVITINDEDYVLRFTSQATHFNGSQLFDDVPVDDFEGYDSETRKLLKEKKSSYSFYNDDTNKKKF
ncbi:MAG: hypothetical protein IJS58_05000 [Bacilli bacterium]|nr:hypothetical protein [Bacilli bacterium]